MANAYYYRADLVGRLIPPETVEGQPSAETLDAWAKRAIQMQSAASMPICTDGEYRRHNLAAEIARRGAAGEGAYLPDAEAKSAIPLLSKLMGLKVSLPAPSDVVRQLAEHAVKTGAAFDAEATAAAAVAGVRTEIKGLLEAGVVYVQLNTSGYDRWLGPDAPADAAVQLEAAAALDRAALVDIVRPDNARIGLRFGRTGQAPVWSPEGVEEAKLATLFALPADRLLIDFGPQTRDFAALRLVPEKTHVVLGVIDNTGKHQQRSDDLLKEIDAAAKHHQGVLLSVSPRGGFNSASGINWAQQKSALELTAEVAIHWWGFGM